MNHTQEQIFKGLKERGERNTPIRRALVKVLLKNKGPRTAAEFQGLLEKSGIKANKTTVYRQLELLVACGAAQEIFFEDGMRRFEAADHHHHLVCKRCKKIEEVHLPEDLKNLESSIGRKHRFKVQRHSLEFYGVCSKCIRG